MSEWLEQEVRNEARSRNMNELTKGLRDVGGRNGTSVASYVCECGDAACADHIDLTTLEYEAVRGYSTRFAIAVDHENPQIDQLVSEGLRFAVIQKVAGLPARIAREPDSRWRG